MPPKASVFKVNLQIADLTRHYYHDHALTLASHPSETDERLMVRVLAFALHAAEGLAFGNGMTAEDEPDLWQKDLRGEVTLWIDVGLPDPRLLRKACHRAQQVVLYTYGGRAAAQWWDQNRAQVEPLGALTVYSVALESSRALAARVRRHMRLHCTVQDGQIWIADEEASVTVEVGLVKAAAP